MFEPLVNLFYRFKTMNRRRLDCKRINKLLPDDIATPRNTPFPKTIKRILFVYTSGGYGDAIYAAGLFKKLSDDGYMIEVALIHQHFERLKNFPFIAALVNLDNREDCNRALARKPDILVDLSWVAIKQWAPRTYILASATCHKVTVNPLCKSLNIYDSYIDYPSVPHMSQRLALVYQRITQKDINAIRPFIFITDKDEVQAQSFIQSYRSSRIVFLNGRAGQDDRCLSDVQMKAVIDALAKYEDLKILVHTDICKRIQSNQIIGLPKTTFAEFCAILRNCDFIISVDTSVVHIASAFNIPAIGIFSPNDRDYHSQYSTSETWSAISDHAITENFDDSNMTVRMGIPNCKMRHMNTISPQELATRIQKDMQLLLTL